jgi:DNA-binding CsgD family transcriptional regulator/tetratricopeptide (TPR) repeat protein/energy-coupling factor transporter ATP-binding protein EcfA2
MTKSAEVAEVHRPQFTELLRAVAAGEHVRIIGSWGSGKTELLRALVRTESNAIFLSGATEIIEPFASLSPDVVLAIDDAHLLSDQGAQIVAQRIREARASVVLTHSRYGDLGIALQRAWKDTGGLALRIENLDRDECATFLSAITRIPSDNQTIRRSFVRSGGILRLLVAIANADHTADSTDLSLVIEALRCELTPGERDAFDTLAIAGRISAGVVDQVVDGEALTGLERHGLVRIDEAEQVSLVAQIFEELTLQFTSLAQRRRIIRTLIDSSPSPESAQTTPLSQQISMATWASLVEGDLSIIRRGLAAALLLPDFDKAISFGRHLLKRDPSDLESAHRLATAFEAVGKHDAASDVARDLRGTHEPLWEQRLRYNNYLSHRDRPSSPDADAIASTTPTLPTTTDDGQETNAHLSWFHLFAGDLELASETAEHVLNSNDATTQSIVWAATVHAISLVLQGHGQESFAALDLANRRILAANDDGANPFADLQLGTARSMVHLRLGEFVDATRVAEAGLASAAHPLLAAAWHGFIGISEREQGNFSKAIEHLRESIAALSGDPYGLGTVAQSELSVCQAMIATQTTPSTSRSTDRSRQNEADSSVENNAEPAGLFRATVLRNRAWAFAATGLVDDACDVLNEALDWSSSHAQTTHEMLVLVDLARFGRARYATERVAKFVRVENPLIRSGSQIISALYDRNLDRLLAAAKTARALSWGVAQDELALLTIGAFCQAGRSHEAARLEVTWNPQSWPTPLCRSEEPRLSLTPRERECALLATQGRTSASIAKERSLSTRTVDNLLSHAYQKCGVSSRRELAEATGLGVPTSLSS